MDPSSLLTQAQASFALNASANPSSSFGNLQAMWSISRLNVGGVDVNRNTVAFLRGVEASQSSSQFGQSLGARFAELTSNRDPSVDDSSITTEQNGGDGSLCGSNGDKKRKDGNEDESSKLVSSSSPDHNMQIVYNGKRSKGPRQRDENGDVRNETETGPVVHGKQTEENGQLVQPVEAPKQDYIHVRARRGQATDSHSLAERARREKISERMKILQDLVPGCNKVIGKAMVLDEIINYIQSLQRQVEFLSMKLEAVNSRMNSNMEAFPVKDAFEPVGAAFSSQADQDYSPGSPQEWLHKQVGGGFERGT